MLLIFLMIRGSLIDDAYITLDYARNLALHLHWGLIPQQVSNTATSPLNVLLLATVTAATRVTGGAHPIFAVGLVSVGLAMLMAWCWARVVRALKLPFVVAVLGVALVLVNPFLLSAVGLEVLLIPTLLVALVATALEGRVKTFGLVAGLLLLTRLDLIVFVGLVAAATAVVRRHWARTLATVALIAGPWVLFSWFYFGSAVPDTLLIKQSQTRVWLPWDFFTGPIMYSTEPAGRPNVVALTFVPAVLGMFAALGWLVARISVRWGASESFLRLAPVAGLGAGGVAYYGVLSLLGPGPYHWYYVPPTTALSMVLVIALGAWLAWARERSNWRPVVPALALGLGGLVALGTLARDVKQGLPWRSPVISTNFATASYYARVGEGLRTRIGSGTVRSSGEIGTVAFYCNCAIIDVFSHRSEFVPIAEDRIAKAGGLERLLLDLNYLWLDRNQKPLPIDYQLRYTPGPGSGRDVWQVWSQWDGVGHVTLTRLVK